MENIKYPGLDSVARSLALFLKILLLIGLFILCAFAARFIIPENFGLFQAIRTGLAAITPVVLLNVILKYFYPKVILWTIGLVWVLDGLLLLVWLT